MKTINVKLIPGAGGGAGGYVDGLIGSPLATYAYAIGAAGAAGAGGAGLIVVTEFRQ